MRQEALEKGQRLDILYFEGVNSIVGNSLAKKTELRHAENARTKTTGTIEKREGQETIGTSDTIVKNYQISYFENDSGKTLFRIGKNGGTTLSISVFEYFPAQDVVGVNSFNPPINIFIQENTVISEYGWMNNMPIGLISSGAVFSTDPNSITPEWAQIGNEFTLSGNEFDSAVIDGNLFLVDGIAENRYIKNDGTTILTSSSGSGHLYNSPPAKKISFYKNRIYLSNFYKNGIKYPTTVLRSSYPLGIAALVSEDLNSVTDGQAVTIKVTDTKYFYTTDGANEYDIYRGNEHIAELTVSGVTETSVLGNIQIVNGSSEDILSSDEIWVAGTYIGEKVFRWVSNAVAGGTEAKLYDSFKISGGDNDEIKMQTTVGDVLLLANNNSLSVWNDYTLQSMDAGIGCVSHRGYVKSYGSVYFIHYTGIYVTNGGIPVLISQKMQRYIDGASKLGIENSRSGKKGRSVFFTIGNVNLYYKDGSFEKTLYDVALEYNIPENNWFVHTNFKIDQFETMRLDNEFDSLVGMGNEQSPTIKKMFSGETDEGDEIHFRVDTINLTHQPNAYENINNPISAIIESSRGSSAKCYVSLDDDHFYELDGKIVKGVTTLKIHNKDSVRGTPPPARTISISIRDSSKQICKIDKMSIIAIPGISDGDTDQ